MWVVNTREGVRDDSGRHHTTPSLPQPLVMDVCCEASDAVAAASVLSRARGTEGGIHSN